MSNPSIPDAEVYYELMQAVVRTGMTPSLVKAQERISVLLSWKPETVEAYCALRYNEV